MEDKKAKILVVDDDPETVSLLKQFLTNKGYEVRGALNGEEALENLKTEKADLILLDMMLPDMKGSEVAKIIKEKYSDSKLIVITGYPTEGEVLLKENLLDALLIKPLRIQELYTKLLETLKPQELSANTVTAETKPGIKARILFIKAKLLFIEPSPEVYNFLSQQFKLLSRQGESYEVEAAFNEAEIMPKINSSLPDIVIVDISYFNKIDNKYLTEKMFDDPHRPKEIVVHNLVSSIYNPQELEKLTQAIRALCLKNGLIEIKWVEI